MTPLESTRARITAACARASRDPSTVRIVAVSKLQPVEKIVELARVGQRDFGENYVQELTEKMSSVLAAQGETPGAAPPRWHLIGHLQKNKIKFISGRCELIHSVDSLSLAEALDRKAADGGFVENILLQANLGGEDSKEGFSREELLRAWPSVAHLENIRVHGLMTMPPLRNEPEQNRPIFRALRELLTELRAGPMVGGAEGTVTRHPLNQLSMGTSHDFEIAVEEGATLVRVGTVLFGERAP